jgi:hypothetical protein
MKKIVLLFVFIAFVGATSFAKTSSARKVNSNKNIFFTGFSCTASASWKNAKGQVTSVSITYRCGDCTNQQQSCDAAYAIARALIPNK